MTGTEILWTILIIETVALYGAYRWALYHRNKSKKTTSQRKSSEVRTGQIAENWAPFMKQCDEFDPKSMKFLGDPIDFVVYDFKGDRIVFMEVKSGNATLNDNQKKVKRLIEEGKVEWKEIRIN